MAAELDGLTGTAEVRLATRPSTNLVLLVLGASGILVVGTFLLAILRPAFGAGRELSLAAVLGALLATLGAIHYARNTAYLVTDERVHVRHVLGARSRSLPLAEVEDVAVESPPWKRALGMADLAFAAGGDRAPLRFAWVEGPETLRAQVLALAERSSSLAHSSNG